MHKSQATQAHYMWLLLASGVVLQTDLQRLVWDACQRFFHKRRENVMFSNKIDLPYCLVVFFVVCPRLRPFWSVFGELACFWCSTAKIKTRQRRDFRSNQECHSLEANNSAGKITPGLNSSTHSKQRFCSSMSIHSIRKLYLPQITSDAFISCSIGFRISN